MAVARSGVPALPQEYTDRYQALFQGRYDNDPYRHRDEWKHGSQIPQEELESGRQRGLQMRNTCAVHPRATRRRIDGNCLMAKQDGTIVSLRPVPRNHQRRAEQHPQ
jgi:hypothetical protein